MSGIEDAKAHTTAAPGMDFNFVKILDAPVRELPAGKESQVFTPQQWETFLALADTVVPGIYAQRTGRRPKHFILENDVYDERSRNLQADIPAPGAQEQDLAREYLGECPSSIPEFKESMQRQLYFWTPKDLITQLGLVLTALGSRPLSILLTGSPTPFAAHRLPERLAIYRSWASSYLPPLRQLHKTLALVCGKAWIATSPTLPKVLGFPRVPVHYTPPAEDYPFDFIQFPSTAFDGPEVIDTDVVIVGSGCGGGVAAKNLAEAGHRVVVVDKAYHYSNKHYPMDPNTGFSNLFASGGADISDDGSIAVMSGQAWGGGGTINWSAALQLQAYVRREWAEQGLPFFTSAQFQRHLDRVYEHMGCSVDLVEHNHGNRVTLEGARKLGYAAKPVAQNTGGKQHYCGHCTVGCVSGAKQSPAVCWLPDAARAGAQFIEGFEVDQVLFQDESRTAVKGVRGTWRSRDSAQGTAGPPLLTRQIEIRAKRVIISCGSLNSPLVLLKSGLKNRNIGRNLYLHPVSLISGIFPYRTNPWEGGILTSVVNEFEDLDGKGHGPKIENMLQLPNVFLPLFPIDDPVERKEFIAKMKNGGGWISLTRERDPGRVYPDPVDGRTRIEYTPSAYDRKHILEGTIGAAKIAYMCGAQEIRASSRDIPVFVRPHKQPSTTTTPTQPQLNAETGPTAPVQGDGINDPAFQDWLHQVRRIAAKNGPLNPERTMLGCAHQMGTCRMGASPKKSVVDPTGKVWGVEGLYVADASVFPSASGVNPMITTYAVADYISEGVARGLRVEGRPRL